MKSHDMAKKLLELPNLELIFDADGDGCPPNEPKVEDHPFKQKEKYISI